MSKKKIFKAILVVLSVILTTAQNLDEKKEPEPQKLNDEPDTYLE